MSVLLTDAPCSALRSVVLTFDGLALVGPGGATPVALPSGAVTTDLLTLDGVSQVLGEADVPAGSYSTLRLSIVNPGTVTFSNGTSAPLVVTARSLDLSASSSLDVIAGQTLLVKLDLDLERSIKLTTTGAGDAVLCPQVSVTLGAAAAASLDGPEDLAPALGTIAAIDTASSSFTLDTGTAVLSCLTTNATVVVHGDGSVATFADLQVGGAVTAEGSVDASGQVEASTVVLEASVTAPTSQSGVLRALDPVAGIFELVIGSGVVSATFDATTVVTCEGQSLSISDLANGQFVTVLQGLGVPVAGRIEIAEERFFADVAAAPDATALTVLVSGIPSGDSKCAQRLQLAGVNLAPPQTLTVRLGTADLVIPSGAPIALATLDVGRHVRIAGRLAPHVPDASDPNPCCIEGRRVVGMPVQGLRGTVQSVDPAANTFVLSVPATEGLACDASGNALARDLPVVVGAGTSFRNGLVLDASLVGTDVAVEGSFQRDAAWQLTAVVVDLASPPPTMAGRNLPSSTSVFYVIDVSGSMGWDMGQYTLPDGTTALGDRLDRAKSELVKSIRSLPSTCLFNIVSHDCDQYFWKTGMVAADDPAKTDAYAWIANLQPLGATGTGPAVAAALTSSPTNKLVVLLSDGGANCGAGDESGSDACLAAHRQLILGANTQGAEIDVVGFDSTGSFDQFLAGIASDNGGTYVQLP